MRNEPVRHGDIELGEMLRILWQRRWLLGGIIVGVTLGGVVLGQLVPPTYRATALVLIEPARDPATAAAGGLTPAVDGGVVESHVRVIGSRSLAEQVVTRHHLAELPEIASAPAATSLIGAAFAWTREGSGGVPSEADRLLRNLQVAREGKTQVIAVTWTSRDPEHAARVANAVASTYIARQIETKRAAAVAATAQLREQVQLLEQAVASVTERAESTRGDGSDLPDVAATARLGELERELGQARLALDSATARADSARHGGGSTGSSAAAILASLKGEQIELARREAELRTSFGERHPRILEVRAEQSAVAQRIEEEQSRVAGDASSEVTVARRHLARVEQELAEQRARAAESARRETLHAEASDEAAKARARLEAERDRLATAQSAVERQQPDARLISAASVPMTADFPRPKLFLSVAFTASLALGLFTVWALESATAGLRDTRSLEKALDLPVLAAVPQLPRRPYSREPHDQVVERPMSRYAESLREVLLGLRPPSATGGPTIVLVTSAAPGEGKTSLVLALGRLAAQEGVRVRVVDADLRRPSIVPRLGVHDGPGLVELLTGEATVEQVARLEPRTPLSLVGSGRQTLSTLRPYGKERLRTAFLALAQGQDLLLVDSAPILAVADTRLLAAAVDTSLLVVRHMRTPAETAMRAAKELAETGTPVTGAVLSIVDLARLGSGASAGREAAYAGSSDYYAE